MPFTGWEKWAPVVLRVVLGAALLPHGAQKLFGAFGGAGPAGTAAYMQKLGLIPGVFWAWVAIVTEFFGGLGLIFGFLTRVWAGLLVIEMIVAIMKVNWWRGFFFTAGGFETPLVFTGVALSLVLGGPGVLSVDRAMGLEKPSA